MGVVLQNDSIVGGIDSSLIAKIGSDPLQTEAQDLSGAVNELVNSVGSDVSVTQKVSSGENIASITVDGTTTELYATNTTYSDFVGATSETDGTHGLVIAPTASESDKYLKGDGTWGTPPDTTYTAATALPGDINTTGAVGVSTDYARQDHTHKIALATGDSNGQVKVAGTNVSVKGLDNSAYKDYTTSVTQGSTDLVTSGAVFAAIDDLPEPMVYKGTLGENGTITTLPTASASNEGFTYKVITAGTYASQAANVGDAFTSNGSEWVRFPAGDPDTDTWRNIKVNGVEKLASGISSGAVDFVDGTNTTVAFDATGNTITVNATDTTYSDFTGATAQTAGAHGLVPAPATTDVGKFLSADGTWGDGGRPMVILSYGNSTWSDFINAYNNNVIVYCRASSNSNPATGAQTRMAFMAYVNDSVDPTNVEFQYYRSVNTHSATQQGDQVFVYKLDKTAGWTVTTRQASSKVAAGTNITLTYANDTITLSATDTTYSDFGGATSQQAGSAGLVPAPTTSDTAKFLKGDGTWGTVSTSDVNVTQTPVSTDANYEVLFSGTADNTEHTEGTGKHSGLKYNPSKTALTVGERSSGSTIGTASVAEGGAVTASGSCSHAEGGGTKATGNQSHSEGSNTTASGINSHAEGDNTTASNAASHSEGKDTTASGINSHAEGNHTSATSSEAHAEGANTTASGNYAHAEGVSTTASGQSSHAEGGNTTANHRSQHVFGEYNVLDTNVSAATDRGDYVEIVGNGTNVSGTVTRSNARTLDWDGNEVLAGNITIGGVLTDKNGMQSIKRISEADYQALSTAEKNNGTIYNRYDATSSASLDTNVSQTESTANADYEVLLSNSASTTTETSGVKKSAGLIYNPNKKALTVGNRASGSTIGSNSVAEGSNTTASGDNSHAEGVGTTASGGYSHAQGRQTTASSMYSHAEGYGSISSGYDSHAEGLYTIANHKSQHVFGEYNIEDTNVATEGSRGDYVEIVGNGAYGARSNARTLDWSGNEVLSGKLTVGVAPTANMDVATKKYVDDAIDTAINTVLATPF